MSSTKKKVRIVEENIDTSRGRAGIKVRKKVAMKRSKSGLFTAQPNFDFLTPDGKSRQVCDLHSLPRSKEESPVGIAIRRKLKSRSVRYGDGRRFNFSEAFLAQQPARVFRPQIQNPVMKQGQPSHRGGGTHMEEEWKDEESFDIQGDEKLKTLRVKLGQELSMLVVKGIVAVSTEASELVQVAETHSHRMKELCDSGKRLKEKDGEIQRLAEYFTGNAV